MILLGLSAYAQSGKDTAADVLVDEFGFERIAFADTLRACAYALNPIIPNGERGFGFRNLRLQDIVDEKGWNVAKTEYDEIRTLLQRMGTEVGRQILGENIWVNTALANLQDDGRYVVTDCRFVNEAKAVKDRGGHIWRVARLGCGPANNHSSETSLDEWDFDAYLYNTNTLENYQEEVRNLWRIFASGLT